MKSINLAMQSTNRRIDESKNSHSGSALLVVLGMLAFMLFSGLAFSVYMRQSRLPTSFLRRTVATRQLAKAALAEAIEEIDTAIGNDPHPGVRASGKAFSEDELDNFWTHRVFTGLGTTTDPENSGSSSSAAGTTRYAKLVDADETVPTLTLEGLAYLPPNLINEARYYSQRTPTAKWHSFWFDSGRYAYTAIDVSDYFDVNRVYANRPRSSGNRVSLAHLFEKITASGEDENRTVTHAQGEEEDAQGWDDFMKDYRVADNKMPLVSLADLNVAWGKQSFNFGGSPHGNPFNNFVYNSEGPYPGGTSDLEAYRGMTFVTDSWFPTTTGNKTKNSKRAKYDLAAFQPFIDKQLNGSQMPSMADILSYQSDIVNSGGDGPDLAQHLCPLGLVQLWDYLDHNRVPVSLAVPTLERVPMIVGVEPTTLPTFKITCTPGTAPTVPAVSPAPASTINPVQQEFTYKITLSGDAIASMLAAYPFRSHGVDNLKDANFDGRMAIFLTVDGEEMSLRPGNSNDGFHLTQALMQSVAPQVLEKSIVSIGFKKESFNVSDIDEGSSKPVKQYGLRGSADDVEVPFFKVVYKWNMIFVPGTGGNPGTWNYQTSSAALQNSGASSFAIDPTQTTINFNALKSDGGVAEEFADVEKFSNLVADNQPGINARVNAAVWVRVTYDDEDFGEKTVDLVPACAEDDNELNGVNSGGGSKINAIAGEPYPLLRYDVKANGNDTFTIKATIPASGTAVEDKYPLTIAQPRIICNDPRYNHQPENWYVLSGSGLTEQNWIDETQKMVGKDERDGDFYLFTSDAGYMQSVYEIAYLPRFTSLEFGQPQGFSGEYPTTTDSRKTFATSADGAKDYAVMWRTYSCYDDPFEDIGLVSGENGQKVNPYTDSKEVLMAAFANTPHDWRVSATNEEYAIIADSDRKDAKAFNTNHAWNDYCKGDETGKMCWDCLENVAETFKSKVREAAYVGNWEEAFADLGWSSNQKKILDALDDIDDTDGDKGKLYSVDKKFLYGFWHDSFAARQQLFLIFVRAEPMMMGGGVSGQVPPQLGARAVALVWRDPTKTSPRESDSTLANPHRTRILFYHQFD